MENQREPFQPDGEYARSDMDENGSGHYNPDNLDQKDIEPSAEINPMYRVFDKISDLIGFDTAWLADNPEKSRTIADTVTYSKIALTGLGIALHHRGENRSSKPLILAGAVVTAGAFLFDSVDGWVAKRGGVAGDQHGKDLDSTIDVIARYMLGAYIWKNNPELRKEMALRAGGEILVGLSTKEDLKDGNYEATKIGKVKVWTDGVFVVGTMASGLLSSDDESQSSEMIRRLTNTGQHGGTVLAWYDGITRKLSKSNSKQRERELAILSGSSALDSDFWGHA